LRELSAAANDLGRHDNPARAATRVSELQQALADLATALQWRHAASPAASDAYRIQVDAGDIVAARLLATNDKATPARLGKARQQLTDTLRQTAARDGYPRAVERVSGELLARIRRNDQKSMTRPLSGSR
jgi:hypothetical protein